MVSNNNIQIEIANNLIMPKINHIDQIIDNLKQSLNEVEDMVAYKGVPDDNRQETLDYFIRYRQGLMDLYNRYCQVNK